MRGRSLVILFLFLFLTAGWLAACETGRSKPNASPEAGDDWWQNAAAPDDSQALRDNARSLVDHIRERRADYTLGPEDKVKVTVWGRIDLSKEGRIRPDGTYFMPLAGNLMANGLTLVQLQALLVEKLGRVLRDPQVDVEITEYASKVFYIFGQTYRPGIYPVRATTTLLEGVAGAGGPTEKANLGNAFLIRAKTVVPVDFYALFQRGDVSQNLLLADGDIIFLPNIDNAKVYVLGEVLRPTAVPVLARRLRLTEAIADAGGFNEVTAYKREIKVIRGNLANPKVYTVDYNDILQGKKPDVPFLQDGDIIFVPASGLAKWDRVLGLLLPNLSQVVVDAAAVTSLQRQP